MLDIENGKIVCVCIIYKKSLCSFRYPCNITGKNSTFEPKHIFCIFSNIFMLFLNVSVVYLLLRLFDTTHTERLNVFVQSINFLAGVCTIVKIRSKVVQQTVRTKSE